MTTRSATTFDGITLKSQSGCRYAIFVPGIPTRPLRRSDSYETARKLYNRARDRYQRVVLVDLKAGDVMHDSADPKCKFCGRPRHAHWDDGRCHADPSHIFEAGVR